MAMICELFLNLKDAKQIKKFVMFVVIAMVGVVAVVSASNKVISSQFEISEEVDTLGYDGIRGNRRIL